MKLPRNKRSFTDCKKVTVSLPLAFAVRGPLHFSTKTGTDSTNVMSTAVSCRTTVPAVRSSSPYKCVPCTNCDSTACVVTTGVTTVIESIRTRSGLSSILVLIVGPP